MELLLVIKRTLGVVDQQVLKRENNKTKIMFFYWLKTDIMLGIRHKLSPFNESATLIPVMNAHFEVNIFLVSMYLLQR